MDVSNLLVIAAIFVVPIAVVAVLLYFVIRAAVLSALRTHAAEQVPGVSRAAGQRGAADEGT